MELEGKRQKAKIKKDRGTKRDYSAFGNTKGDFIKKQGIAGNKS